MSIGDWSSDVCSSDLVELGDIDDVGPDRAPQNREIVGLVADRQRCDFGAGFCVHREVPDEVVAENHPSLALIDEIARRAGLSRSCLLKGYLIGVCAARWPQAWHVSP